MCLTLNSNCIWCSPENRDVCKNLFLSEYASVTSTDESREISSDTTDASDFFSCLTQSNSNSNVRSDSTVSTVSLSLNISDAILVLENKKKTLDVLNYYPGIKEIFLKYNTMLPSLAPVKRIFSSGSQILVPRRCNLGDQRFETLLFLKCNSNKNK